MTVTKMIDGGWWEGVCNGKLGWFPGNYVEEFQEGEHTLHSPRLSLPFHLQCVYMCVMYSVVEQ